MIDDGTGKVQVLKQFCEKCVTLLRFGGLKILRKSLIKSSYMDSFGLETHT